MKLCVKCKEIKPVEQFTKNAASKDNLKNLCKVCSKIKKLEWAATPAGRASILLLSVKHHKRGKRANLEKTLVREDILNTLKIGKCQLTGLPFDFHPTTTRQNPYAPSLDRIDSQKGYTKDNIRVVLASVNMALGEHSEKTMLPILKEMVRTIEKNAKENTATPISTEYYIQGAVGAELGSVSTPWAWEDYDHTDDHSGADARQDADHSAQEGGGDGVGHGGQEVGTFITSYDIQNHGEPSAKIVWIADRSGYIPNKP